MQAFEWDEDKRLSNVVNHDIDFRDVRPLFDGRPILTVPSPRGEEERFSSTGLIDDSFSQ